MTACPTCGETDDLSGTPVAGDIEVTCGACGTAWRRGDARCKGCGVTGGIPHRQVMTRTPRGNQVAVVGHREIVLCPACDAAAMAAAASAPVPQDYVSVFLFGVAPPTTEAAAPASVMRQPAPEEAKRPPALTSTAPRRAAPPVAKPATPAPLADPTTRQAIEAYLTAQPGADSLATLMLGRHLGPSRRVRELDHPTEQQRLQQWFDQTWTARDPRRRDAARVGLGDALAYWRTKGWIRPETLTRLD